MTAFNFENYNRVTAEKGDQALTLLITTEKIGKKISKSYMIFKEETTEESEKLADEWLQNELERQAKLIGIINKKQLNLAKARAKKNLNLEQGN